MQLSLKAAGGEAVEEVMAFISLMEEMLAVDAELRATTNEALHSCFFSMRQDSYATSSW